MSKKNKNIEVKGISISVFQTKKDNYISLTDIAKSKDGDSRAADIIKNWIRNRGTIEFIGTWEKLHNPGFKVVEFDHFRMNAGLTSFVLSPGKWIEKTDAIGIIVKGGRYGGTYAHKDIAFEFCSAISPIFKLYLIKEFQRLKDEEQKQLGWDIKRNLTKINYRIHTDAIKQNLIPKSLTKKQISFVYANEADILNVALFGKTAKQWREENPKEKGNIRDYANVNQLVCLANLENLNAVFINDGLEQSDRLVKLNQIAINQMKILLANKSATILNPKSENVDE
ncbi:MAG: KilA-N domain-containing protein [Candidatus Marinimicrobia bacterium]|nr:KilA-N domain-containing protein [Candidatus Neomarinimicrobiota bacterium]